jgi:hypothetical protein
MPITQQQQFQSTPIASVVYEREEYPKVKYSPTGGVEVVISKDEEDKLGAGWYDSPAGFGVETAPAATGPAKVGFQAMQGFEAPAGWTAPTTSSASSSSRRSSSGE